MSYEKETLKLLRDSLDEEDDEASIINILENHHKYLREYVSILQNSEIPIKDKQATASLFFKIFNMHAKSEEETFYQTLKYSTHKDLRLEGLRSSDEHQMAFEIISELKELNCLLAWSEEIEARMQVLTGLVKNHLKEEENIIFPMAEDHIPESKLIDLTSEYLEKCKFYLDVNEDDIDLAVSRTDVMTFFY